jgi:hypothetical protein
MKALQFEATKIALKQDSAGYVLTLRIHPDDLPEELFRDFVGARYGCALVRIGDDERPITYVNRAQRAGMLCKDRDFQFWAFDNHFIDETTEQAAINYVYDICSIKTRSELNNNLGAQNKFDELVKQYGLTKEDPF